MSQLALDLRTDVTPTLDNFVPDGNEECLARLRDLRQGSRVHRFIHLWGLPGSGRSHLAKALAEGPSMLVVDDVQHLDASAQVALFSRFIEAAGNPQQAILTTSDRPPLGLALREDLRTRLGAGLVFELRLLADAQRATALAQAAHARGVITSPDLIPWLLTHHSRDLRVLLATLDQLDRYALERKRPLTLPLMREWLAAPATGANDKML